MGAEEKILQGILYDANLQAEKILADGEIKCEEIRTHAADKSKAYAAKTISEALRSAKAINQNSECAADLTVRDARLAKKHEEINATINAAVEKITALPDDKYFNLLCSLAVKNARGEEGSLMLSAADLIRDVSAFEKLLISNGVNVKLSKTPAAIKNGFILKYGDIEYNLSLEAVIVDKKDAIQDSINSILFAE